MMPRKKQTGFTTYTPNTIFSDLISKRRGGGEIPVGEREREREREKRLINQFSNLIYKTSDNQVMVGR